ncbi:hypothetical protein [Gordonia sp. NB41Y]|uniref:hypothetical protein n=1 Tax=Gordonia sp. NB41Y TaxID=875808 RepID=UPI0006B1914D|nr:hypothetical protein [Gordonia sp. NB41Y]EMP12661.2 hypothetical protein ISGA_3837 [Gordonia sp. NB41Y]WLP88615.1 hypothetical protein Q9K23_13365 [Gordonia sp. NB41Y]
MTHPPNPFGPDPFSPNPARPNPFAPGAGNDPFRPAVPTESSPPANPFGPPAPVPAWAGTPPPHPGGTAPFGTPPSGYLGIPAAAPVHTPRPPAIVLSAAALTAAGLLVVVQTVFGVIAVSRVRASADAALDADPTGTADRVAGTWVDTGHSIGIGATIALGVIFAASYALFTIGTWRGHRWPRYAAIFLAVLSLFGLLAGPVVMAIVVCGLLATAGLWLPPSRRYTEQRPAAR